MSSRLFDLRAQTRALPLDPPWEDKKAWRFRAVPVFNGQNQVIFAVDDAHEELDAQHITAHCGEGRRVAFQKVDTAVLEAFLNQHHSAGKVEGQRLRDARQTA